MSVPLSPQQPEYEQSQEARRATRERQEQRQFWIALAAPVPIASISLLLGMANSKWKGLGYVVGLFVFVGGVISSILCGVWVGRRVLFKSFVLRVLSGLLIIIMIGFVYSLIASAVCSFNLGH